MKFECDKCGLCCKNIRFSDLSAELDRGDGVCKHLKNNLCEIYSERPIFCNVDAYYEKFLSKKLGREEFYNLNFEVCERLKKIDSERQK